MDFSQLVSIFVNLAGDAVIAFVGLALVDALFGVAYAVKNKVFDWSYLPNFLSTNLGTKYALVVLAAIVAANQSGGDLHQAALAVVAAGGFAMSAALIKDIVNKALAFVGKGPIAARKAAKPKVK